MSKIKDFKIVGVTDDEPPYQLRRYWLASRWYFLWIFPTERFNFEENECGDGSMTFSSIQQVLTFINSYYELNLTFDDVLYEEI